MKVKKIIVIATMIILILILLLSPVIYVADNNGRRDEILGINTELYTGANNSIRLEHHENDTLTLYENELYYNQ